LKVFQTNNWINSNQHFETKFFIKRKRRENYSTPPPSSFPQNNSWRPSLDAFRFSLGRHGFYSWRRHNPLLDAVRYCSQHGKLSLCRFLHFYAPKTSKMLPFPEFTPKIPQRKTVSLGCYFIIQSTSYRKRPLNETFWKVTIRLMNSKLQTWDPKVWYINVYKMYRMVNDKKRKSSEYAPWLYVPCTSYRLTNLR
jgi:hypothetical protein